MRRHDPGFSAGILGERLNRLGVARGARLVLAYSGGLDSQALLHALAALRETMGLRLSAVHIDHGLHPQSSQWADHCRQTCAALGLELHVECIDIGGVGDIGLEAAARRARYAALMRHVGPGDGLLTAHHRDDQIETLLMRLMRGAGVHGLAGMAAVAPFGAGLLLRPLLDVGRTELVAYARTHGLHWIEDTSNIDTRHARNYLRHRVLPLLRRRWPSADAAMARAAAHCAEAAELLDDTARSDLERCLSATPPGLSVSAVLGLTNARVRALLRYWLRQGGFDAPSRQHLDQIVDALQRPSRSGHAVVRWAGAEVHRYRDLLQVLPNLEPPDRDLSLAWSPDRPLAIPGTGHVLSATTTVGEGVASRSVAGGELRVRLRRGGERCRLPGQAHHRTLKNLLQEAGVPPWQRSRLPLLYIDGELAAVADRWVCDPFAAGPGEPGWRLRWSPVPRPPRAR